MIAADAIREAASTLTAAGIETARLDAEVLLRHVLRLDRTHLFVRLRDPISDEEARAFATLVDERASGVPVAYLTGEREFMGRPFAVGPGVLVPRPETELLVEWALVWLSARPRATVVDIGTGSGAIAVSLAAELAPERGDRIVGSDISARGLDYAARNIRQHAHGHVDLVKGDLASWCQSGAVDLLLANLPYLTPGQLAGNPDLRAEPEVALVSGDDGLRAISRLVADAPRVLRPGGALALELDPAQATTVAGRVRDVLPDAEVSILHDLAGWERVVIATPAVAAGFR